MGSLPAACRLSLRTMGRSNGWRGRPGRGSRRRTESVGSKRGPAIGCPHGVAHLHAQTLECTRKTVFANSRVSSESGSFPLVRLAGSIDSETLLPHPPSNGRVAVFTPFTGQPFQRPLNTTSDETVPVYCLNCSQSNNIPWITYEGDGLAQRGFGCVCNNCRFMFSRENLGVRKFYSNTSPTQTDSSSRTFHHAYSKPVSLASTFLRFV